jgi:hypothetical protein
MLPPASSGRCRQSISFQHDPKSVWMVAVAGYHRGNEQRTLIESLPAAEDYHEPVQLVGDAPKLYQAANTFCKRDAPPPR